MSRYVVLLVLLAVAYAAAQNSTECAVNQVWNICGSLCEPTCDNPHPIRFLCPAIQCTPSFTGGCRCQKGYVRNSAKACVALEDC
ncbi:chymotrypsin inhibitor [Megachile rotundata]|uniref:chymotrypsin inhibitor n=1 Tax=Megachile rotundata TaxID=143995 RepID=UPI000258F89A|nr:PREDICTED: chymotrypsin inhibitor-like [Megachile rotundata]